MNKILTTTSLIFSLFFFETSFAMTMVTCTPTRNSTYQINIIFPRDTNPLHPFVGFLNFMATVQIFNPQNQLEYENKKIRVTPEVYTTDINLRGDAEGVYLRLYPQITNDQFTHYTGQIFINDLDTKNYYNFRSSDSAPGFVCR